MTTTRPSRLRPGASRFAPSTQYDGSRLRVATYNIHKGVRGMGLRKRLEIHNLGLGVEALDADLVFLQEVRLFHRREARRFERTWFGWPEQGQADFLAPEGYDVAYRTNAITRHGEHGNALLSRWPMGDVGPPRRQRRTASSSAACCTCRCTGNGRTVHAVVAHFGLTHGGRAAAGAVPVAVHRRQFVPRQAPVLVAGDFNDWSERLDAPMRSHRPAARRVAQRRGAPAPDVSVARAGVRARPRLHARLALHVARRCRAARPGRACPTTCRWWSSSSRLMTAARLVMARNVRATPHDSRAAC